MSVIGFVANHDPGADSLLGLPTYFAHICGNDVSERRSPLWPVANGDPATSVRVPFILPFASTLKTLTTLFELATYNRFPSALVAIPAGRKDECIGNAPTSERLPPLASLNDSIVSLS